MGKTNGYGAPPRAHREPPPGMGFSYALTIRNPVGASPLGTSPPPPGSGRTSRRPGTERPLRTAVGSRCP
jgi:hypothetical protein